jgi:hypothetical protein
MCLRIVSSYSLVSDLFADGVEPTRQLADDQLVLYLSGSRVM